MFTRCFASFTAVVVSAIQLHRAHTLWSYLCACIWHNHRIPSLTAAKSVYPWDFTVEYKLATCIQHAYDHRPVYAVLQHVCTCMFPSACVIEKGKKPRRAASQLNKLTFRKILLIAFFQRMRGRDQWCSVHAQYEAGVRVTGRHGAQQLQLWDDRETSAKQVYLGYS